MGKKAAKKVTPTQMTEQNLPPVLQIDYEGIYAHQKKLEVLCQKAEHDRNIELFAKIKYKQNIYQVGEFVQLYDPTETLPYVVKIHSIIRIPAQEIAAILKVEWLLRKTDLPAKYQKHLKNFSVAEVFPSGQFDYVLIESIMRKCYVIEYSEYQFLQNAGDNIHFSRAVYDPKKAQLEPSPDQWPKQCYCQSPINPDLPYVQCQKCQHWFHNDCVNDPKLIEAEQFVCRTCVKGK